MDEIDLIFLIIPMSKKLVEQVQFLIFIAKINNNKIIFTDLCGYEKIFKNNNNRD